MSSVDWWIVVVYLAALLLLAFILGRTQSTQRDYYLGGNRLSPWALATSTIATQCSTNSLLGAPAFVGFVAGGGMLWLQYELAVPLAMFALIFMLVPIRRAGHITLYEFLETRLGTEVRLLASGSFQLFRGVATGVTVYGVASVLTLLLDISYTQAVLIFMGATIAYDVMGGIRAVVISDVIQMILIVSAVSLSLAYLIAGSGWESLATQRLTAIDWSSGTDVGNQYAFWPMLIGGFFLYCAYYGCDQSQAQRVLAARSTEDVEKVLVLNGLLRFPVVLLYCLLGLALAAYAASNPGLIDALPSQSTGDPNYNLIYPVYVLTQFPSGLTGLVMVGIFAAAMSSIDSALNSLSAATLEDFANRDQHLSSRQEFWAAKISTLGWGLFAIVFSYQVEAIAPTILEAINKVGSTVNGPLLALFLMALTLRGLRPKLAVFSFFAGVMGNLYLWQFWPQVSWLWWNAAGFLLAYLVALACYLIYKRDRDPTPKHRLFAQPRFWSFLLLIGSALTIFSLCLLLTRIAANLPA